MIYESLPIGKENALTSGELSARLGLSRDEIRRRIFIERRAGKAICATCGSPPGYFVPADRREMENFCRSLFHRAEEIHLTREACEKTLPDLPLMAE